MQASPLESHQDDPLYREALRHLQLGEWELGLFELNKLIRSYPLSPELRTLRQEAQVRAKVDDDEKVDNAHLRMRSLRKVVVRLTLLLLVIAVIGFGVVNYWNWMRAQMAAAQVSISQQVQRVDLAVKLRQAQDLVTADRPTEAKAVLADIANADPKFTGLAETLALADAQDALGKQYDQAMSALSSGDVVTAKSLFESIAAQRPEGYRDVSIQLSNLKKQGLLADVFNQAEANFTFGNWAEAVTGYESLRQLDPTYQKDTVKEHLYTSYVNAAKNILATQSDSLEALNQADEYFLKARAEKPQDSQVLIEQAAARDNIDQRKCAYYVSAAEKLLTAQAGSLTALKEAEADFNEALKICPDNESIQNKRQLTVVYLQAWDNYGKQQYNDVITGLEKVLAQDPSFAMGGARQTLYEAYMARGDSSRASGDYNAALEDYQRAAVLSQDMGTLNLYEAKLKVAYVQGTLGNYETAVQIYRDALNLVDANERAAKDNKTMMSTLQTAEDYAKQSNFRMAFQYYNYYEKLQMEGKTYKTVNHVVGPGDYLTGLAARYHSSVALIVLMNNLANPNLIIDGQTLVIPILP